MKTIKVKFYLGEIDTTPFTQKKFPNREDTIFKIAQKLKKPVSEIRKNKSIIDTVYNKMIDAYFDNKIVSNIHWLEEKLLNKSFDLDRNDDRGFNGWQEKTFYNPKTKTFNVKLCYKNRLEYEKYSAKIQKRNFNKFCPKFVQHWLTNEGKKEIEFIEKTLQQLGKIKIEVYNGKNKKLDTFYVQYKRTNITFKP